MEGDLGLCADVLGRADLGACQRRQPVEFVALGLVIVGGIQVLRIGAGWHGCSWGVRIDLSGRTFVGDCETDLTPLCIDGRSAAGAQIECTYTRSFKCASRAADKEGTMNLAGYIVVRNSSRLRSDLRDEGQAALCRPGHPPTHLLDRRRCTARQVKLILGQPLLRRLPLAWREPEIGGPGDPPGPSGTSSTSARNVHRPTSLYSAESGSNSASHTPPRMPPLKHTPPTTRPLPHASVISSYCSIILCRLSSLSILVSGSEYA